MKNNTTKTITNSHVLYLPPNTVQVTTSDTSPNICGYFFTLASNASCTLQLLISGPIDANDPDPRRHLFVCAPGNTTCAGPLIALNIQGTSGPKAKLVWQVKSPDGGGVQTFAIDNLNPSIVYAGASNGGAFKSINGGQSWRWIGASALPNQTFSKAIVVDPKNPDVVYYLSSINSISNFFTIIYKSTNGGLSWTPISDIMGSNVFVNKLVINPVDTQILYAGLLRNPSSPQQSTLLFQSRNAGSSWLRVDSLPTLAGIPTIEIDPQNPLNIYTGIASAQQSFFNSINGGNSWTLATNGLPASSVISSVIDPLTPSTIYAGLPSGLGVYKSVNRANNWAQSNVGLPVIGTVSSLAINPKNPNILYAGIVAQAIYKTITGGALWASSSIGLPTNLSATSIVVDPINTDNVYISSIADDIYKSINGAASWNQINTGLNASSINAVALDPVSPQIVYTAFSRSVFKSVDGGTTWLLSNNGIPTNLFINTITTDPNSSSTIYLGTGTGGIYKSTNAGLSWNAINVGLGTNPNVRTIAVTKSDSQVVYAGIFNGGMFKSINGGNNWTAINTGLSFQAVNTFTQDPNNGNTLYVGLNTTINQAPSVFKTVNGGASWTPVNNGLKALIASTIAVNPNNSQVVYLGGRNGFNGSTPFTGGLYKSNNGGQNWQNISNFPGTSITSIEFDPSLLQTVYVSTSDLGVFVTENDGLSWQPVNVNLQNLNINILKFQHLPPFAIYAGTAGNGLFKSLINNLTVRDAQLKG